MAVAAAQLDVMDAQRAIEEARIIVAAAEVDDVGAFAVIDGVVALAADHRVASGPALEVVGA